MKTKINLSVIAFMLCILQPASGYEPGFTDEGNCTETTSWRVDALETGGLKLTIYGIGATHNAHHGGLPETYWNPYVKYVKDIVEIKVGEGITHIGTGIFGAMIRVRKITLPEKSLTDIGLAAFNGALASDCETRIPSSVINIGGGAFLDAFADVKYLPEPSAELTDEQFQYLLRNCLWPDTVPLYFEHIPVHSGNLAVAANPRGIFGHDYNDTVTAPVIFYVKEGLVASAQQSDVFLDAYNRVNVVPVAYKDVSDKVSKGVLSNEISIGNGVYDSGDGYLYGNFGRTTNFKYFPETKTLYITGYGELADSIIHTSEDEGDGDIPGYPWCRYSPIREETVNLIIMDGITRVGAYCFRGFTKLKNVYLPETLLGLYYGAFSRCPSLKKLVLPAGLQVLGPYVLGGERDLDKNGVMTVYSDGNGWRELVFKGSVPPNPQPGYGIDLLDVLLRVPYYVDTEYKTAGSYVQYADMFDRNYGHILGGWSPEKYLTGTPAMEYSTSVTVTDTVRKEYIITDTIYRVDTVNRVTYNTEYEVVFVKIEISTALDPPVHRTDSYLSYAGSGIFNVSSPYLEERIYFYDFTGRLLQTADTNGRGYIHFTGQIPTVMVAVSNKGWYQVIR